MRPSHSDEFLIAIGIMTGNSLDGADAVLTKFSIGGEIKDLAAYSEPMPRTLSDALRTVRAKVGEARGDMTEAVRLLDVIKPNLFYETEQAYTTFIAGAVRELLNRAQTKGDVAELLKEGVDIIGSHGQTCAHCPPSIAAKSGIDTYTVQIGNAQILADVTGITVASDFRSDDLMNGGEGAPFAPIHHRHLAEQMQSKARFPFAFLNGGNTSNISIISRDSGSDDLEVYGWDAGPFNNFPDALVRAERGIEYDRDGLIGQQGRINESLVRMLFERSVRTADGRNFLMQPPPKSSDPDWYVLLPELTGAAPIDGKIVPFEDRLRTAEYFSVYLLIHTLSHLPAQKEMPHCFATCGGGWRNPLCYQDLIGLLRGDPHLPILRDHMDLFAEIRRRCQGGEKGGIVVEPSEFYGVDGTAMEARIFADAAVCRVMGRAFTIPQVTGSLRPAVCGILRYPSGDRNHASERVRRVLSRFHSESLTPDLPDRCSPFWSRASAGWRGRMSK